MEPTQSPQVVIQTWQAIVGLVGFVFVIGVAWGTLKTDIKHIGIGLKDLKTSFDDYIQALARKAALGDGNASSPYNPSPTGKALLTESGANDLISRQDFKDWIFPLVDKKMPKADFEVEQKVLAILLQTQDDARWNPVKEFIFNHPVYGDRPLTIDRLLAVVSWVLRDEYIASRKIKPAV